VVAMHIAASVFINDDADLSAGCTIAPARMPVLNEGQGLAAGKLGRRGGKQSKRPLPVADHGPRGCGRRDQWSAGRLR
jgi:hypothetical protein